MPEHSWFISHLWLVPALPFLGFLIQALLLKPFKPNVSSTVAILAMAGAAVVGWGAAIEYFPHAAHLPLDQKTMVPLTYEWLRFSDKLIGNMGVLVDDISMLLVVVVTTISTLIHIYSTGYMHGDKGYRRFFACLNLFSFSMLGLVLSVSVLQIFIFWELVGVSSFLLIGFYWEKPSAVAACKKAFIVTRFADLGFLLGLLMLSYYAGKLDFVDLTAKDTIKLLADAKLPILGVSLLPLSAILVFCGAAGKSAMFPLHIWLPDAMEGPTPVSALIHAATMVVAGVYLVARMFPMFAASEAAIGVVMVIGAFTSLFAAVIATTQFDIKRVLAFSTLSQLGYMMLALGVATMDNPLGFTASMFHLTTHACFKALLFLGAGSVIIALHHEQDIWKMGGLWKKTPVTFGTFLIGTLALAGVPPLSGFYSKDEILLLAFDHNKALFVIAVLTALLTAYYMGREVFVVFFGKPRDHHAYDHAHESPAVMTLPLVFLAVLSVIAGWGDKLPEFIAGKIEVEANHPALLTAGLICVPVVGFLLAAAIYLKREPSDAPVKRALGPVWTLVENKYYFDELYALIIKYVQGTIAAVCELFDRWILQRLGIGGLSGGTNLLGRTVRLLQTGSIPGYAFLFGLGVTVIIYYVVVR